MEIIEQGIPVELSHHMTIQLFSDVVHFPKKGTITYEQMEKLMQIWTNIKDKAPPSHQPFVKAEDVKEENNEQKQ